MGYFLLTLTYVDENGQELSVTEQVTEQEVVAAKRDLLYLSFLRARRDVAAARLAGNPT